MTKELVECSSTGKMPEEVFSSEHGVPVAKVVKGNEKHREYSLHTLNNLYKLCIVFHVP